MCRVVQSRVKWSRVEFKTVEFSVSPPSANAPATLGTNGLGKSVSGGTPNAEYKASYDQPTDTIRISFRKM